MQNQSQNQLGDTESEYTVPSGHYDEAFDLGNPRSHWQYLLDSIDALGTGGLYDRHKKASRILRDDGATFALANDPLGSKTWELDPIPMLISSDEWSQIEAGLVERSELLDLVLKDIYGPRELIRQSIIPPEIIYHHPGFLRQCQDICLPSEHQLTLHAVDMIRGPDGRMIVTGDRTQAPSGAGYALENRTVLSRVMPSLFRDSQVHRLALFFQSLRSTLNELGSLTNTSSADSPQIVILTPGAYSETYFEHTYLSNYLGFPLVQGSDLTVRDGCVWLKSLTGLSRVDVILRRVDDIYCDPVELKSDSYLGIPGLTEVIRAGNVVVSNPLGSGILETPALLKFLPAIAQHFLGRELILPSVETWWCGDKEDMAYIEANLDHLIIKPTMRQVEEPSIYGHTLSDEAKLAVIEKIRENPYGYVAQNYVAPSYLPTWQDNEIQSRPSIMRSFMVASDKTYVVMAGGLTRVGLSADDAVVTNLGGSQSKDTWILASEPEKQLSLIEQGEAFTDKSHELNIPSRVVENLFWMGRYAERAESTMRLIRTVFMQINGIDPLPKANKTLLLQALSKQTKCLPGFLDKETLLAPDQELSALILDSDKAGSVKSSLLSLLMCSEEVKEMLSADTHRIINDLRDHLHELDRAFINGVPSAPEEALDPLVTTLLALSGLSHESMLRGVGWHFQEIGRRIERSLQTASLIDSLLTTSLPNFQQKQILESVLLSVEALITFRRRYRDTNDIGHGLDLLMLDDENPRSIIYQLHQLERHYSKLPPTSLVKQPRLSPSNRLLVKSLSDMQLADVKVLATLNGETRNRDNLKQLLGDLVEQLEQFSSLLSDQYFDHQSDPQQLAGIRGAVYL